MRPLTGIINSLRNCIASDFSVTAFARYFFLVTSFLAVLGLRSTFHVSEVTPVLTRSNL